MKNRQDRNQEYSHDELLDKTIRAIKTVMIGSLASCEEHFGHLWGHGKDELTEDEEYFFQIWTKLREDILEKGNNNMDITEKNFSYYSIERKRYKYTFRLKRD